MFTIALTIEQQALVVANLCVAEIATKLYCRRWPEYKGVLGELLSSAYLGLCNAAKKFDEFRINERTGLPIKFSTYAKVACNRQILEDLRAAHWHSGTLRNPGKPHVSLIDDVIDKTEPVDQIVIDEDAAILRAAINRLVPCERDAMLRRLAGEPVKGGSTNTRGLAALGTDPQLMEWRR